MAHPKQLLHTLLPFTAIWCSAITKISWVFSFLLPIHMWHHWKFRVSGKEKKTKLPFLGAIQEQLSPEMIFGLKFQSTNIIIFHMKEYIDFSPRITPGLSCFWKARMFTILIRPSLKTHHFSWMFFIVIQATSKGDRYQQKISLEDKTCSA